MFHLVTVTPYFCIISLYILLLKTILLQSYCLTIRNFDCLCDREKFDINCKQSRDKTQPVSVLPVIGCTKAELSLYGHTVTYACVQVLPKTVKLYPSVIIDIDTWFATEINFHLKQTVSVDNFKENKILNYYLTNLENNTLCTMPCLQTTAQICQNVQKQVNQ